MMLHSGMGVAVNLSSESLNDEHLVARIGEWMRAIVEVARDLNIDSVAEMVESNAVLAKLRELGVGFVQGGQIHPPAELQSLLDTEARAASQVLRQVALYD